MRCTFFPIPDAIIYGIIISHMYLEQIRTLIMKYEISSIMQNPGKKGYLRIHATPSLKRIKIKIKVEIERQKNRKRKKVLRCNNHQRRNQRTSKHKTNPHQR